jgi:hypothetical protein
VRRRERWGGWVEGEREKEREVGRLGRGRARPCEKERRRERG